MSIVTQDRRLMAKIAYIKNKQHTTLGFSITSHLQTNHDFINAPPPTSKVNKISYFNEKIDLLTRQHERTFSEQYPRPLGLDLYEFLAIQQRTNCLEYWSQSFNKTILIGLKPQRKHRIIQKKTTIDTD